MWPRKQIRLVAQRVSLLLVAVILSGCIKNLHAPLKMTPFPSPNLLPSPSITSTREPSFAVPPFSPMEGAGYLYIEGMPGFWYLPEYPDFLLENESGLVRIHGGHVGITVGLIFHPLDKKKTNISGLPCQNLGVGEPGSPICYRLIQDIALFWPTGQEIRARIIGGGIALSPIEEIVSLEITASPDKRKFQSHMANLILIRLRLSVPSSGEAKNVSLWIPLEYVVNEGG